MQRMKWVLVGLVLMAWMVPALAQRVETMVDIIYPLKIRPQPGVSEVDVSTMSVDSLNLDGDLALQNAIVVANDDTNRVSIEAPAISAHPLYLDLQPTKAAASWADNDDVLVRYRGVNDSNEVVNYATVQMVATDVTSNTEDSVVYILHQAAGVEVTEVTLGATGVTLSRTLTVTGTADFNAAVEMTNLTINSGATIAGSGQLVFNPGTGGSSFNDENVTNVGVIALDTIVGDGTSIAVGDGTDTVAIDSSDWDINAAGNVTGINTINCVRVQATGVSDGILVTNAAVNSGISLWGGEASDAYLDFNGDQADDNGDTMRFLFDAGAQSLILQSDYSGGALGSVITFATNNITLMSKYVPVGPDATTPLQLDRGTCTNGQATVTFTAAFAVAPSVTLTWRDNTARAGLAQAIGNGTNLTISATAVSATTFTPAVSLNVGNAWLTNMYWTAIGTRP